jgi:hypothetical protein
MTRWIGAVVAISALPADGLLALEGAAPKRAGPTIRKLPAGGGCEDWRKKFAKFRIYAVEGLPPQ